jgi:HK97 family phage portal protein
MQNWFSNLFGSETRANPNAPNVDSYITSGYGNDFFNVGNISEAKIMSLPTVSAAINLYASVISSLPLEVYTKGPENYVLDETNPIWDIVSEHVNDEMSATDWIQFIVRRAFINGRSFTYIERDAKGYISNLYPLDNTKMEIRVNANGTKKYVYKVGGLPPKYYTSSEIIDIYWQLKSDAYNHVNPMRQYEEFFTNSLLVERFANAIFKSGPKPPLVAYKKVSETSTQKSAENTKKALDQIFLSDGLSVLPDNLTLANLPYDPSQSQVLETRKFLIGDAARIYNVPPTLLHDLTTGTFNNTEQTAQNFLKFNLSPWLLKIEKELNLKLLGRNSAKNSFIRFNTDELLRGDLKSLAASYSTLKDKGIMTSDEVRYKFNLPAKGGNADELSAQVQYQPINQNLLTDEPKNEQN